jgi:hypothetical protein
MRIRPIVFLMAACVFAQDLTTLLNDQLSGLVEIYKDLHAHPELSHQESRTAALLATKLRKAGYTVRCKKDRFRKNGSPIQSRSLAINQGLLGLGSSTVDVCIIIGSSPQIYLLNHS